MLNRIKKAVANATKGDNNEETPTPKTEKFLYARPYFLGLSKDEVENSRDFGMRPIFIPRNFDKTHKLPFNAGYAECINGGKSDFNEDNSYACVLSIKGTRRFKESGDQLPQYSSPVWPDNNRNREAETGFFDSWMYQEAVYFGVFDGHAGYHASLIASRLLHRHLQDKLEACLEYLLHRQNTPAEDPYNTNVTVDELVIGALEEAFADMDAQLDRESSNFIIKGGCTALVALFMNDKLYIANAGDCRAVLCQGETITPVSRDFNPESERQRINYLGHCYPELLHNEFSCTEFTRRLNKNDLGKRTLCRNPGMEGWSTKIVTEEDLRFPLITGEGRKARVMATIGVTRGLGDHKLTVYDTKICIKPFLSSHPEVRVIDLSSHNWTDEDVLIIGSDGLYDGVTNEEAVAIVRKAIQPREVNNKGDDQRYIIAAQELINEARGSFTGRGWRKKDGSQASFDDITAFVIPIKPSIEKWKNRHRPSQKARIRKQIEEEMNHSIPMTIDHGSSNVTVSAVPEKNVVEVNNRTSKKITHSKVEQTQLNEASNENTKTSGEKNDDGKTLDSLAKESEEEAKSGFKDSGYEDFSALKADTDETSLIKPALDLETKQDSRAKDIDKHILNSDQDHENDDQKSNSDNSITQRDSKCDVSDHTAGKVKKAERNSGVYESIEVDTDLDKSDEQKTGLHSNSKQEAGLDDSNQKTVTDVVADQNNCLSDNDGQKSGLKASEAEEISGEDIGDEKRDSDESGDQTSNGQKDVLKSNEAEIAGAGGMDSGLEGRGDQNIDQGENGENKTGLDGNGTKEPV